MRIELEDLRQMDGGSVETGQQNFIFALSTLVVEGIDGGHAFLIDIIIFFVSLFQEEGGLI